MATEFKPVDSVLNKTKQAVGDVKQDVKDAYHDAVDAARHYGRDVANPAEVHDHRGGWERIKDFFSREL